MLLQSSGPAAATDHGGVAGTRCVMSHERAQKDDVRERACRRPITCFGVDARGAGGEEV